MAKGLVVNSHDVENKQNNQTSGLPPLKEEAIKKKKDHQLSLVNGKETA